MTQAPPTGTWAPRRAAYAYAGAGALGLVGLSTAGAAMAGMNALTRVQPSTPAPDATVTAIGAADAPGCTTAVTLRGSGADDPGWAALVTRRGRLLAGPPARTAAGWKRDCVAVPGAADPVLDVGSRVSVSADAWTGLEDPFRLGGSTLHIDTDVGRLATASVGPPDAERAVVYVHGRGGNRATGWWLAPTCVDAGWRTVMPAYRNDADGPLTGRYLLGGEWVDLSAVLDHLAADGVAEVVLVGWSMGGNICASYLRQRARAPERFAHHPTPVGLVLDAAALDWGQVLRHIARHRRLPRRLVPLVMGYGSLARRIDWRDLNHLADPDHLALPLLSMHGDADEVVPAEASIALTEALPHAQLEVFAGAGHCRSLNIDPARYLGTLRRFLDTVGTRRARPTWTRDVAAGADRSA